AGITGLVRYCGVALKALQVRSPQRHFTHYSLLITHYSLLITIRLPHLSQPLRYSAFDFIIREATQ
ncbi:MAG: hypothetical protein QF437_11345, partial [Planctomycetota bacterium]|nr:hypothetical protein [Planctomycetota bacterium]